MCAKKGAENVLNQVWLIILAVMVGGSILKYLIPIPWAAVAIDLAVLAVAYIILRRYPYINLKRTLNFLVGLTVISIAVDLGFIDGFIGNIALLILLAWLFFSGSQGGGSGRPPKLRHKWHK